ncbi:unnamed protein product [Amoebophrya sp. A120]|nr:unnamed protein product [Amoebophrya sp. A120]|eukprot:GSA120T00006766001.1
MQKTDEEFAKVVGPVARTSSGGTQEVLGRRPPAKTHDFSTGRYTHPKEMFKLLKILSTHEDLALQIRQALRRADAFFEPTTNTTLLTGEDVAGEIENLAPTRIVLGGVENLNNYEGTDYKDEQQSFHRQPITLHSFLLPLIEHTTYFNHHWQHLQKFRKSVVAGREKQVQEVLLVQQQRLRINAGQELQNGEQQQKGQEHEEQHDDPPCDDSNAVLLSSLRKSIEDELEYIDEFVIAKFYKQNIFELRTKLFRIQQEFAHLASKIGDFMDNVAKIYYERLAPLQRIGCGEDVCSGEIARNKVQSREIVYYQRELVADKEPLQQGGTASSTEIGSNAEQLQEHHQVVDEKIMEKISEKLVYPKCELLKQSPGLRMAESHLWPPPLRIPEIYRRDLLLYGKAVKKNAFYMQKSSNDSWAREVVGDHVHDDGVESSTSKPSYLENNDEEKGDQMQEDYKPGSFANEETTQFEDHNRPIAPPLQEELSHKWNAQTFGKLLLRNPFGWMQHAGLSENRRIALETKQKLYRNILEKRALKRDYALNLWTDSDLVFLHFVNETVSSYQDDTVFILDAAIMRNRDTFFANSNKTWHNENDKTVLLGQQEINLKIAVLGSEQPWMEILLLYRFPTAIVTTVDYRKPPVEGHPDELDGVFDEKKSTSIQPRYPHKRWRFLFFHELLTSDVSFDFDMWFSYSSIEHAGLGRYGDALNPFADVQTMALIHCHTKKFGKFFLGPACIDSCGWLEETTSDTVYFNAGRDYGRSGWARLLMSWAVDLEFSSPWLEREKQKQTPAAKQEEYLRKGGYLALVKV